jgi:hypothetical protein
MTQHEITDTEYAAALVAGQAAAEEEVRAQAVRYVPDRDAIEIVTAGNAGFLIPRGWIGALQDVPTDDLAKLENLARRIGDRARRPRYPHQRAWLDDCDPARDAAAACHGSDFCKPRRQSDFGREAKERPGQRPERRPTAKGSKDRGSLSRLRSRDYFSFPA